MDEALVSIRGHQRAVRQYTLKGTPVARYRSIYAAGKATGIDSTSINKCCRGIYKQAGGYYWKYQEDKTLNQTYTECAAQACANIKELLQRDATETASKEAHLSRYKRFMHDIDNGLTDEQLLEKYETEGFTAWCVRVYRKVHDGRISRGSDKGISWADSIQSLGGVHL